MCGVEHPHMCHCLGALLLGIEGQGFVSPWVHPRLCTLGCHEPTMTPP